MVLKRLKRGPRKSPFMGLFRGVKLPKRVGQKDIARDFLEDVAHHLSDVHRVNQHASTVVLRTGKVIREHPAGHAVQGFIRNHLFRSIGATRSEADALHKSLSQSETTPGFKSHVFETYCHQLQQLDAEYFSNISLPSGWRREAKDPLGYALVKLMAEQEKLAYEITHHAVGIARDRTRQGRAARSHADKFNLPADIVSKQDGTTFCENLASYIRNHQEKDLDVSLDHKQRWDQLSRKLVEPTIARYLLDRIPASPKQIKLLRKSLASVRVRRGLDEATLNAFAGKLSYIASGFKEAPLPMYWDEVDNPLHVAIETLRARTSIVYRSLTGASGEHPSPVRRRRKSGRARRIAGALVVGGLMTAGGAGAGAVIGPKAKVFKKALGVHGHKAVTKRYSGKGALAGAAAGAAGAAGIAAARGLRKRRRRRQEQEEEIETF